MPFIPHVNVGEPVAQSARDWNALIDAARTVEQGRRFTGRGIRQETRRDVILMGNATGGVVSQYDCVGIGSSIVNPSEDIDGFAERLPFYAELPTANHWNRFAIAQGMADIDGFFRAIVGGVTMAKVHMIDESHVYADIASGQRELYSCEGGAAHLLWVQPPADRQADYAWCLVRLGGVDTFLARITGSQQVTIGGVLQRRWRYPWVEVRVDSTTDAYADVVGGRSGTVTTGYAVNIDELDNTAGDKVPTGSIVEMSSCPRLDDGCQTARYRFASRRGCESFMAKITDRLQVSGVQCWTYAWEEVRLDNNHGVVTVTNGRTGTTTTNYAMNMIEVYNLADHTGTQGNSVYEARSGFPSGFHLQPVGGETGHKVNVIVEMKPVSLLGTTVHAQGYVFWYPNAEDGACA